MDSNKILLIVIALFIPPLAVFLKKGNKLDGDFWLNLVLTFLGGIPGILHALYVILR
jgi:uncharacterized membrane protein YqaE (UPF0057 family)